MDPATVSLLIGAAIKYGPGLAMEIVAIFKKKDATLDDIEAVLKKMQDWNYDAYIAAARAQSPPTAG